MAHFASEAELEAFLGRLDPDDGQYASAVWQNGVRTAHQLANADKEDLVAATEGPSLAFMSLACIPEVTPASGNSQLSLWLDIPLPLLHIPNVALQKTTKKDMTDSGMRVVDAHAILAEIDHFKVAYAAELNQLALICYSRVCCSLLECCLGCCLHAFTSSSLAVRLY